VKKCHKYARYKGFWSKAEINLMEKLMLIVTEVSELAEAYRRGEVINEEAADIAIRLFDFCGFYKIDLEGAMRKKMKINEKRPYMHGKRC